MPNGIFPSPKLKALVSLLLIALFAGGISTCESLRAFERLGWPLYDYWQRVTAESAMEDVVVVIITQNSINEFRDNPDLKLGWPWPREVYGPFLEVANKLKASSVTFDLIYDSPSVYGTKDDESFSEAIRSFLARNPKSKVVFPAPTDVGFQKPNSTILSDLDSRLTYGAVNIPIEKDGVYRRMLQRFRGTDGVVYPSLGEAAVRDRNSATSSQKSDSNLIRFYKKDSIQIVDIVDVFRLYRAGLSGEPEDEGLLKIKSLLKEKHWILGVAAAGLYDLRPIPTDERAPGVYVHATHALNLLNEQRIDSTPISIVFLLSVIFGALIAFLVFNTSGPRQALIGSLFLVIIGAPAVSFLAWLLGFWFNPLPQLTGFVVLSIVFLSYRFQTEWRERERLIQSVKNSMSESMVQLIRSGKLNLSRFGERREVSILFSDLSGFTSLAESTDPHQLVEILNLYLDECVDLIFRHDGYVDKFIGDAIMALWGAPVTTETSHAKLAFDAAFEYQDAVDRFNKKARGKFGFDRDLFVARVGLHTGKAICGNIGSQSRYNYTAVGDSVNLASRLEGLGKHYNLCLLISDDAVRAAGLEGSTAIYMVDRVAVKGRTAPVTIYSTARGISPDKIEGYRAAYALYLRSDWAAASRAFDQVLEVPPAVVMRQRCQSAMNQGELKQLKIGVWHHDEK